MISRRDRCPLPHVFRRSAAPHPSVVEQELAAVEQRPVDVVQRTVDVAALCEERGESGDLLLGRLASQTGDVQLLDDLDRRQPFVLHGLDDSALSHLGIDDISVHQVEGLRQRGLHLHLARARGFTSCPSEGREKVIRCRAVGDLDCS